MVVNHANLAKSFTLPAINVAAIEGLIVCEDGEESLVTKSPLNMNVGEVLTYGAAFQSPGIDHAFQVLGQSLLPTSLPPSSD